MQQKSPVIRLVLLAWLFSGASAVFGWGAPGHTVISRIADQRLSDQTRAQVADLLGPDKIYDVASWADQIRNDRRETAPWHYVDIPVQADAFDEARDGQKGDNVIDAINRFTAVLADHTRPKLERAEALKFLIHFVGDLHQPLHCADRNGDKGGNTRLVFFLDQPMAINLHAVWDTSILKESMGDTPASDYAAALNNRITPVQAADWASGTPRQWANECHKVAVDVVYKDVPVDGPPPKLGHEYVDRAKPVVDGQLQRAGVRLAFVLNSVLGTPAATMPSGAAAQGDLPKQ